MQIIANNGEFLPAAMVAARRWLLWKLIPIVKSDGTTANGKIPFYTNGSKRFGDLDGPEDVARLATFQEALALYKSKPDEYAGLGFALGKDIDGLFWQGIDYDFKNNPNLRNVVNQLPGYVELSPSKNGVHGIGKGAFFTSTKSTLTGIEAYSHARYFTVTGERLTGATPDGAIVDISEYVNKQLRPKNEVTRKRTLTPTHPLPKSRFLTQSNSEVVNDLSKALGYLNPHDYHEWVEVGMALKTAPSGFELWSAWSSAYPKFDLRECERKWASFHPEQISYKTVFHEAGHSGWQNPKKGAPLRPSITTKTPKPTAAPIINLQALTAKSAAPPTAPNAPVDDDDPLLELDHPELRNRFNCPAPYKGYMQMNYEAILRTAHRKQPHLTIAATLSGMASQIPSSYAFEDGLRTNIYLMGVAGTATGKDHIRKAANRIAYANAVGRATEMPSSHSGLYEEVEGVSKKLTQSEIDGGKPEKGEQVCRLDMSGKHLCFISDEIAILFKAMLADKAGVWDAKLVRLLLDFFSKSSEYWVHMQSLKGILGKHIPHPMISVFGLAQPELLAAAFDEGDITSGLLGRFLLFRGETNPEQQKRVLPFKPVGDPFKPFTNRELDPLNKYSDEATRPEYADRLIDLPETLADGYIDEFSHREQIEDDKSIKAIYARSYEKVKRIAGILACFENRERPVVNQSMMDWAKALVLHCDENLVYLIEKEMQGNSSQARENRRVLGLLKKFLNTPEKKLPEDLTTKELDLWKQEYMSRRRLMRSSHLTLRQFEIVIADLIAFNVIKADHRNGMEAFTAKK